MSTESCEVVMLYNSSEYPPYLHPIHVKWTLFSDGHVNS